jgi:hypothetical protein
MLNKDPKEKVYFIPRQWEKTTRNAYTLQSKTVTLLTASGTWQQRNLWVKQGVEKICKIQKCPTLEKLAEFKTKP